LKIAKKLNYMVSIMPKTVTAETAATPSAKFLFFSILFSSFSLESRSVTLTLLEELLAKKLSLSGLKFALIVKLKHNPDFMTS